MDADPWGRDVPPATRGEPLEPLPPRLADLAGLTGRRLFEPDSYVAFPKPDELPEVQQLAEQGWHALEEAPLWWCLPAVWPMEHRMWVADRLPRIVIGMDAHGLRWAEPWPERFHREMVDDVAREAVACGLPVPPTGRLWLLRSPWPSLGVDVVLLLVSRRCEELGLQVTTAGVTEAARDLLIWREEQVWAWWTGPEADVARAWRAAGRDGEDVAALILASLGPGEVAVLTAPEVDGGGGLTEGQCAAWCEAVGRQGHAAVDRIRAWRALGLPANPPSDHHWVLSQARPEQAAEWFAAGFDLDDMATLGKVPLQHAIAWRQSGFRTDETGKLLAADPTLLPREATAFDDAGIAPIDRLRWVEAGFDATAARAWVEVDVAPNEARVWRSVGKGPDEARGQQARGAGPLPPGVAVGWFGFGTDPADRQYGVVDPPGTRGRLAQARPPFGPHGRSGPDGP